MTFASCVTRSAARSHESSARLAQASSAARMLRVSISLTIPVNGDARTARLSKKFDESSGSEIKNMLGVDVTYFVRYDSQDFFVGQAFDQLRIEHDDRALDAARKSVRDRILLHEKIRHIDAKRCAGDLELRIEIRTLFRRNFYGAGRKNHSNGRFAGDNEKFLQCRINAGNRSQRCECASVGGVDVLFLIQVGEFFVRLIG